MTTMKLSVLTTVSTLALLSATPAFAQNNSSSVTQTGSNSQAYATQQGSSSQSTISQQGADVLIAGPNAGQSILLLNRLAASITSSDFLF